MKPNYLQDAQEIANLIELGTADKRDLLTLLMYIREEIPNGMVKDLAHSVAHTSRNRGYAFERIEAFVSEMIAFFQVGGELVVRPVFEVNPLIKELSKNLAQLGIQLNRSHTYRNRAQLLALFEELLTGVNLQLKNPNVESCYFERIAEGDSDLFCFVLNTQGLSSAAIPIPVGVGMCFPLFGPTSPTISKNQN